MTSLYLRTVLLLAAAAAAATAGPLEQRIRMGPVETGPGTLSAARKYLHGRWALLSYEIFPPGQPPVRLDGEGTLLYDDFGNLQMDIRVDGKTALILEGAGIQTSDGLLSTKGLTIIDLQSRTLVFVLDGQPPFGTPAGPLALNRPRHWEVDEGELTLTTRDEDGRPLSVSRWRKEER
jgi:hypothetical protein